MKIAVIKQGALGDLISLSAFLLPIKETYPEAEITILASKYFLKVYTEKLLYHHFYCFDKHTFTWKDYIKTILFLRTQKFAYIFQLRYGSEIDDFVAACSGARNRVGFKKSFFSIFLNHKIDFGTKLKHEYLRMMDALKVINITKKEPNSYFYASNEDKIFVSKFLLENNILTKKYIFLAPRASSVSKEWLPEQFIALGKLISEQLNFTIIIDNGLGKDDFGKKLTDAIGKNAYLSPPTSIHQFGEFIRQSALCVCNNSAPMNIAFAVNTTTIAISSLPPNLWGAMGKNDTTLYPFDNSEKWNSYAIQANDNERRLILNKISPEMVFEEVKSKLKI